MKALNYLYLLLFISLFAACNDNDLETLQPQDNQEAILDISLDRLLPVSMNTKADPATRLENILSQVNDLNIRVHLKNGTSINGAKKSSLHVYCFAGGMKVEDPDKGSGNVSYIGNKDFSNFAINNSLQLHFGDITVNDVDFVEVIANANRNLYGVDFNTVRETQSQNMASQNECMMYGRSSSVSSDNIHGDYNCKKFDIVLKRTRALLTFVINTSKLKDGVEIMPKVVRLRNLPHVCNLTSLVPDPANGIGPNQIKVISDADVKNSQDLVSVDIAREQILEEPILDNKSKPYGSHAVKGQDLGARFFPLFMFENMQGNHTPVVADPTAPFASERAKYPTGITTVAQAKNRELNFKYSYLELEAGYKYTGADGVVQVSGTIIYRFFLGSDATKNFDIEGNHYYKLTLNLSGFGGASEDGKVEGGKLVVNDKDISWRVDMNTTDWGFEKSQYDFDSHYIDGAATVLGTNWKFWKEITGNGDNSWLVINITGGSTAWANPTQIANNSKYKLNIVDGKLRFQVQPMYVGTEGIDPQGAFQHDDYLKTKNYREMKIVVQNLDIDPNEGAHYTPKNEALDTVVVRQYVPIPIDYADETGAEQTVYMERFEEYNEDSQGKLIVGFPWKYEGNDLSLLHTETPNCNETAYSYDTEKKDLVGRNTVYLVPKKLNGKQFENEGKGSAAAHTYEKGKAEYQGGVVRFYALPSESMMTAMIEKLKLYDPSWGPIEPIHIHEDYWTGSVKSSAKTSTIYYSGNSKTFKSSSQRNSKKRIRAVFTNQTY